jgi:DNA-3-methyladenine glycosylase
VPWTDPPPPRDWFRRDPLELARDLLGAFLVSSAPEGVVVVRITEVEAYRGGEDPASHAFRGPTPRNATMFGDGGHLYVYRHMGLHYCANVAANVPGVGHGVLLRAGEVVAGRELALARRTARGVCRTDRDLVVVVGEQVPERLVSRGPRVGVAGAGDLAAALPYRLWVSGDPHVSAFRP